MEKKAVSGIMLALLLIGMSPLSFNLAIADVDENSTTRGLTQTQYPYDVEVAFPNLLFGLPVGIYHAGDGTNRLFVVEQRGRIYVFENSENVANASVFLDIRDRVLFGGEQGLLGLAFHPNFAENEFFYVDYVAYNPRRTVISRYSVASNNTNEADENSEKILLEVEQPTDHHNGGQITFGPDGYLYIALGDGGQPPNGQNLSTLLGSILRIDVGPTAGDISYSIPSDNPFVGNTQGYREEIYAYGLRNPWRFSFDPETGWLWAADVGADRIEEIDIVEKGKNYGWAIMEGSLCRFPTLGGCNQTGLELPIWEYNHTLGVVITGGFVYRGSELTELIGAYIYGDWASGRIWALWYNGTNDPVNTELLVTTLIIPSFGVDEGNELYICASDGKIYKLRAQGAEPFIYTDKYSYSAGDTMQLGLDIVNLGPALHKDVVVWLEKPIGGITIILHAHNKTLPAGLNYSNPSFKTFTLPSIPSGIYTWHSAFLNPTTHTILVEDTAEWQFI